MTSIIVLLCVLAFLIGSLVLSMRNDAVLLESQEKLLKQSLFDDYAHNIIVDKETGVQYFLKYNYGMCVRVDSLGKPLLAHLPEKIADEISDNTDEKLIDEL